MTVGPLLTSIGYFDRHSLWQVWRRRRIPRKTRISDINPIDESTDITIDRRSISLSHRGILLCGLCRSSHGALSTMRKRYKASQDVARVPL